MSVTINTVICVLCRAATMASECPVLSAWSKSQFVLQRLLKKDLLVVSSGKLTRRTCVDNRELLVPLINLVGCLTTLRDHVHYKARR